MKPLKLIAAVAALLALLALAGYYDRGMPECEQKHPVGGNCADIKDGL